MIAAAMMPEYVKAGIISEEQLKKIYATWIIKRHLPLAYPKDGEAHRMADLLEYNYLAKHNVVWFDDDKKLHMDFALMPSVCRKMLGDIIDVQLAKSPAAAKAYIDQYGQWSDILEYVSVFKKKLGVKPYIDIQMFF